MCFNDVQRQVIGWWVDLKSKCFECLCCVGSISNISLVSDVDLRNLITLCHHASVKVVAVDLRLVGTNSAHSSRDSAHSSRESAHNPLNTLNLLDVSDSLGEDCSLENFGCIPEKNQNSGQIKEFVGSAIIPCYDVSPMLSKSTLLSDCWADIMTFGVGLQFHGGAIEFRHQLIKYTTRNGFKFKYIRNDAKYVHAICNESLYCDCDWFIKAKSVPVTLYFEVYKANLVHKCVGKLVNNETTRLGPKIIGDLFLQTLSTKPNIGGKDVIKDFQNLYGFHIPYWKAWRTIEAAKNQLWGSYDDSYDQLRWYCAAISSTNPGSVVSLEHNSDTQHFERVFISFNACIEGFKSCRPMLFVDGTFMKGRAKGTLLAATAKDGDNGISSWFVARRKASETWTGALCPTKEESWHVLSDFGRSWLVVQCTAGDFEVSSVPSVRVDLKSRTCSCHQWQVTGFPCAHAVAVIRRHSNSVFSHVNECFYTVKYRECYMHDLHPIPDTQRFEFQSTLAKPILPPILKRAAGRPKKKRIPSYGEYRKKTKSCCPNVNL
ncbi:hypothetical protein ACS0TY_012997 [Phlomoides rotata]